jgi:hypothetical protein
MAPPKGVPSLLANCLCPIGQLRTRGDVSKSSFFQYRVLVLTNDMVHEQTS